MPKGTTVYTCGTSRCVRGNCGHFHITLKGAVKCLARDQSGCRSQGGYSDREIIAVDSKTGDERPLNDRELESV